MRLRDTGNEVRQSGFAAAGGAPENDGGQTVGLNRVSERPTFSDDLILARQIIEGLRTHSFGQRRVY